MIRKIVIGASVILGILLLIVLLYVAYVCITYRRIEDNQKLEVVASEEIEHSKVKLGTEYTALTYNIGFGAYSNDYSFFMDGGEYSRAFDKESVINNTNGSIAMSKEQSPDFMLFQEVDVKATRSYGVNQKQMIEEAFSGMSSVFAVNFDSAYLFYPITSPHGKSLAGMSTFAKFPITSSIRRSLPISTSLYKFVDLDRCYTISRIPVENGKELCIYNVHLSAYTDDATIVSNQVKMLSEDLKKDYEAGNYIVCGGDFNQDLLGNSPEIFGTPEIEENWAKPFPKELLSEGLQVAYDRLSEEERVKLSPSCRNADQPYKEGETFVTMVDGFIVSDNIEITSLDVTENGFLYSDHQPVTLKFKLK